MIQRPIGNAHRNPEEMGFDSSVLGEAVRVGMRVGVQQGHAQVDLVSLCRDGVLINEPRVEFIPAATEPMKSCSRESGWARLRWAGKVGLMHTKPGDRSLNFSLRISQQNV